MTPTLLGTLFAASLLAGFVDSIAGGGGLITLPTLLLSGLPPILALGTNKVQGTVGSTTAAAVMIRHGVVNLRSAALPIATGFAGAALGSAAIQAADPRSLDAVVPVLLIAVVLYFALAPKAGEIERHARMAEKPFSFSVIPTIGFYDGFLGPGTGSFLALSGVALRGQTLLAATGVAKAVNAATNVASMLVFVLGGKIVWPAAAVMMVGQGLGAALGARLAIRRGASLIRPLIVTVSLLLLARYFWQRGWIGF